MNKARHDAYLGFPRSDHARAVWPYQAAIHPLQVFIHLDHVCCRDALRDTYDHSNAGIGSFHNGIACKGRGHKDH